MERRSQIKIELVKDHISEPINYYGAIIISRTILHSEMISKIPVNYAENTSRIYLYYRNGMNV